jgi:hypothetical protein
MSAAEKIVDKLLEDGTLDPKGYVADKGITIPTGMLKVVGSHGSITCESATGDVVEIDDLGDDEENYRNISRINVDEYRQWIDEKGLGGWRQDGDTVDILFVGYWNRDGSYEPPEEEARLDYELDRRGQQPP